MTSTVSPIEMRPSAAVYSGAGVEADAQCLDPTAIFAYDAWAAMTAAASSPAGSGKKPQPFNAGFSAAVLPETPLRKAGRSYGSFSSSDGSSASGLSLRNASAHGLVTPQSVGSSFSAKDSILDTPLVTPIGAIDDSDPLDLAFSRKASSVLDVAGSVSVPTASIFAATPPPSLGNNSGVNPFYYPPPCLRNSDDEDEDLGWLPELSHEGTRTSSRASIGGGAATALSKSDMPEAAAAAAASHGSADASSLSTADLHQHHHHAHVHNHHHEVEREVSPTSLNVPFNEYDDSFEFNYSMSFGGANSLEHHRRHIPHEEHAHPHHDNAGHDTDNDIHDTIHMNLQAEMPLHDSFAYSSGRMSPPRPGAVEKRRSRSSSASAGASQILPAQVSAADGAAQEADKPFICQSCSKGFRRQEHLRRHMKTHTHERPYACTVANCGRKFSRSDNLKAHILTHAKKTGRNVYVEDLIETHQIKPMRRRKPKGKTDSATIVV